MYDRTTRDFLSSTKDDGAERANGITCRKKARIISHPSLILTLAMFRAIDINFEVPIEKPLCLAVAISVPVYSCHVGMLRIKNYQSSEHRSGSPGTETSTLPGGPPCLTNYG